MSAACMICTEEKALVRVSKHCTHADVVCKDCLGKHIHSEMHTKMFTSKIPCPSCKKILEHAEVTSNAPGKDKERYETLTLSEVLQAMPEFRFCTKPGCGAGQLHDGGDDAPIMTCVSCHAKSCFTHRVPFHFGETCAEYTKRLATNPEDATSAVLHATTKPCPNPKCKKPIEKKDGCDHMTCPCGHEFCWLCLQRYDRIRKHGCHHHGTGCRYYAPYTPKAGEEVYSD